MARGRLSCFLFLFCRFSCCHLPGHLRQTPPSTSLLVHPSACAPRNGHENALPAAGMANELEVGGAAHVEMNSWGQKKKDKARVSQTRNTHQYVCASHRTVRVYNRFDIPSSAARVQRVSPCPCHVRAHDHLPAAQQCNVYNSIDVCFVRVRDPLAYRACGEWCRQI